MNNDYYQCNYCKHKQDTYTRFCPSCNSEKSIHIVEDGKIIDMLVDIVNVTSRLLLMNCSAHSGADATREDLVQWLEELA